MPIRDIDETNTDSLSTTVGKVDDSFIELFAQNALSGRLSLDKTCNEDFEVTVGKINYNFALLFAARNLSGRKVLGHSYNEDFAVAADKIDANFNALYATFLGAVATRGNVPYGYNSGNTALMSETVHQATDNITALQLVYANWYIDTNNNTNTWQELGTAGAATIKTSIVMPDGTTFVQVKWGGSVAGSIASGATAVSDMTTLPGTILAGQFFKVRTSWTGTGILYNGGKADATLGDRFEFTATDKTLSGTVANSLPGYAQFPVAVIAQTTVRSALLIGTSRTYGFNDTADGTTGNIGIAARGWGTTRGRAYCNAGIAGDSLQRAVASFTKRAALKTYFTDVLIEHGINDGGRTLLQKQTDMATMIAAFSGKTIALQTIAPNTSSTDSWATATNQTILQDLTTYNDWIRTLPSGVSTIYDVADALMTARNSNKWKFDGTSNKYTDDGLHGTQYAYLQAATAAFLT